MNSDKEIWSQLDQLSAHEIIGIVEAAVEVLKTGWEGTENFNELAPLSLMNILRNTLVQKGIDISNNQLQILINENETSLNLSRKILAEIAYFPELAHEVEKVYNARQKMMGIEPISWLLAGALFALAIKVKQIDLKKRKIQFYDLPDKALEALFKLLNIGKGL